MVLNFLVVNPELDTPARTGNGSRAADPNRILIGDVVLNVGQVRTECTYES